MVHKVKNISQIDLPLESHAHEGTFKIYPLDVGLLGALLEVPAKLVLEQEGIFRQFKGALAECFVAEELISHGFSKLYYWTSSGNAEIDFVVPRETQILPLEVKSGSNLRSKSLSLFGERYPSCQLTRVSTRNFENNGRFQNFPLYSLSVFSNFTRDITS
jgi:predicted AAA+ superfamily ATPase